MRRASKILTLILVVVFLFGIFAGCDLVGKNTYKYRSASAIAVGNQTITVGKLLDTFNSYYNSYYYYISYGYFTVDDVLDMAVQSLISQYMKVDAYTTAEHVQVAANKGLYANAEYLTQEQLNYTVSYVKYVIFKQFDGNVMEKIEAKYELNDEEAEDTSRDFYEYDKLDGFNSYADYYLNQNFTSEDLDEYLEKYYDNDPNALLDNPSKDLLALYLESAQAHVDELNERVDEGNEKVDLGEYKKYQEAVYKQYANTIKSSYGLAFDEFLKLQIEDMINGGIVNLYNYNLYNSIEGPASEMNKVLQSNADTKRKAQQTQFKNAKNYESFIEGLSDSSFIYDVPAGYETNYVFVKNILIPFSDQQTAWLNSFAGDIGTTDDERYTDFRNWLATQIVADDFNSTKNDDGEYATIEGLFTRDNEGNVIINSAAKDTALSQFLSGGTVLTPNGETQDQVIHDLMARFNTDTAQHSSLYSYVVRVNAPDSYTHRWVDEFVQATKDAMEKGGAGHYGIGVSDYGVHIVYVEGYVTAQTFDFSGTRYLDPTTPEYRLFKSYFETQASKLISKDLETLQKKYVDEGKISETSVFKKFLKENKIKYDLAASLSDDED